MIKENQSKYDHLRLEYNVFYFERFEYKVSKNHLMVQFYFKQSDQIHFSPKLEFQFPSSDFSDLPSTDMENLVFHIGMVELISYWKAACSPKVIIKPFKLSENQIDFWKKLYFNGLGEFFYLNGIHANINDFMSIHCESMEPLVNFSVPVDERKILIPIGGGKDSIVTLELLKEKYEVTPFFINPGRASLQTAKIAGFDEQDSVVVTRTIDPNLIRLNQEGFLNGHTPFSALLAFISLLSASMTGNKYIPLSNESSANEPTVLNGPNHQYSKSWEFENDFRTYVQQYISKSVEYFSFLRPLSEYKIASLFAKFPQHIHSFRSCNVGSKKDEWCGKCPKCLFTAIILSPFINYASLKEIFDADLFDDMDLLPTLKELTGISEIKPFECVGTTREVNLALVKTIQKIKGPLPALLNFYQSTSLYYRFVNENDILDLTIGDSHFLADHFLEVLSATKEC